MSRVYSRSALIIKDIEPIVSTVAVHSEDIVCQSSRSALIIKDIEPIHCIYSVYHLAPLADSAWFNLRLNILASIVDVDDTLLISTYKTLVFN